MACKKNLRAADQLASTSHCMAEEIRTLALELTDIAITPFGVDIATYKGIAPFGAVEKPKLVIGTVKTMKPKYGIDTLIEAYAQLLSLVRSTSTELPEMELRLVGGGDQTIELKAMTQRLGIAEQVKFIGWVPHAQVPLELAKLDVYVALSRFESESFGVAIIEAGAAGRPVVVSDAGGLPEVCLDGETGFVVPAKIPKLQRKHLKGLYSIPVCVIAWALLGSSMFRRPIPGMLVSRPCSGCMKVLLLISKKVKNATNPNHRRRPPPIHQGQRRFSRHSTNRWY